MSRSGHIVSAQPELFDLPMAGVYPVTIAEANDFLVRMKHDLGPVNRPFRQEAFGLRHQGQLIAVAVSASIVSATVDTYRRGEVVELARLAASERWATRVMLRFWREVCAPAWTCWPVRAAISYSQNSKHTGDIYRFDGWRKVREDCGSAGGGAWSRKRYATDAVYGRKTLWIWDYPG